VTLQIIDFEFNLNFSKRLRSADFPQFNSKGIVFNNLRKGKTPRKNSVQGKNSSLIFLEVVH